MVGVQQILSQQINSQLITNCGSRTPLFSPRTSFSLFGLEYLTSNQVLCWLNIVGLKIETIRLKGGLGVLPPPPPPKKIKTKKAGEDISGHFVGAILPKENEDFQRKMLQFNVCSF